MPALFVFPSPDNMSINDPHLFVARQKVVGLYNQTFGTSRLRMTPEIEAWFSSTARGMNWVDARFSSDGCTLTASLIHEREARLQRDTSGKIVSLDQQARRLGR